MFFQKKMALQVQISKQCVTLLKCVNISHLITQRLEHGEGDSAGRLGDVGRHGDDLAVALVDKDGYESRLSDPIAIESPVSEKSIVVSPTNVAEVLVPILLVIVVLGAALAYYVQRNRRLSRSFAEFASRYSPASGSASILNHSALDDDDDYAPIIRGFSDNEPLVVSS